METADRLDTLSDLDDTQSTSSTLSASKVALTCPDCQKELQSRHMFNHIRKLHPEYFKAMSKVWQEDKLECLIKSKAPYPCEWEYKNDFDETEFKNIWGCLACNSTFTIEAKGRQHVNKDKCKTNHFKAIKDIITEEKQEKVKRLKSVNDRRTKWANRTTNDIYNDTLNTYQIIQNKIFNEYIPYFQRMYEVSKDETVQPPSVPRINSPVFSNDLQQLLNQEEEIQRYQYQVEAIIKRHHMLLPINLISDDTWTKLGKYYTLSRYVKLSVDDYKPVAYNTFYPNQEWGYIHTPI